MALKTGTVVKTISPSGQISLGKKYAGRTVVIDEPEEGVWHIKTAQVIPDNELWLHQEPAKSKFEAGLKWAETQPTKVTDLSKSEEEMLAKWEAKHSTKK
jgi:hypothetical protein